MDPGYTSVVGVVNSWRAVMHQVLNQGPASCPGSEKIFTSFRTPICARASLPYSQWGSVI
ncbi:hypothetical protein MPNT_10080 [Candidatus Methylacidithermus pantelleriae]|uniref:Uncharacterized protein n=1 Tax=Candidatus Methylacidithermus pantelleriae TaxID=2744239 RepID=A0A8J2BM02_9BACT|nr:hypothetical protein MPNT_10080 [Candidatus Methylacidithermus pantelleriae]